MVKEYNFICKTEQETASLAAKIAALSQAGDVFALNGTLGMGKSVFARGFIQSLCGNIDVPSPTFTLVQTYDSNGFVIYHYDLYRLKKADEIFELGMEEAMYDGVCLIEWSERMAGYLPLKAININIAPHDNGRQISIVFPDDITEKRFVSLGCSNG